MANISQVKKRGDGAASKKAQRQQGITYTSKWLSMKIDEKDGIIQFRSHSTAKEFKFYPKSNKHRKD